jgi:hypothetical protein
VYRGERSGRICRPRMCGRGGAFSVFFIFQIKRVDGWVDGGGTGFFFPFIRDSGFWVIDQSGERMTGFF